MSEARSDDKAQDGSALVVAIFVLALLTSMGAALLFIADSDVKMNKAGLRAKAAFYQAEAGLEAARQALRVQNLASAFPTRFNDELAVAAGGGGIIQLDPATVAPVYNAAGHVTGFTGYGDDVPLVSYTSFNGGWYAAFLTNDPIDGRANLADTNDRLMITAIGATSDRAVEVIQAIVDRNAFPPLPATITMLGPSPSNFAGGSSGAKNYEGDDCDGAPPYTGVPGLSMPVVGGIGAASEAFLANEVATKGGTYNSDGLTGSATADNSTSTADPNWSVLIHPDWTNCSALQSMAASIKDLADYVCTTASPCSHWGSSTISTITFVEGDLSFGPSDSGMGVLWVTGSLTLRGGTDWEGPIIVVGEGDVQRNGGGSGHTYGGIVVANITGPDGIYGNGDDCTGGTGGFSPANFDTSGGGNHDTIYCSDAINQAMNGFPFKVVEFRQR